MLKKIDFSKDHFIANGVKYNFTQSMSINRWIVYQDLQHEIAYGVSFEQTYKNLDTSIDLANKGKGIEAWNIILSLRDGISTHLDKRVEPTLLLCSLFMNEENEDITVFDEQKAKAKIENWKKEYDVNSFFLFAFNMIPKFITNYENVLDDTLTRKDKKKKSTNI